MKTLELHLSDQTASKLQEVAERLSLSPEEVLVISLEEKLAQLDAEFRNASEYVLKKNAELYRRLA
jgi:antitoxin FitA